jgi:alpha-glucosidase
MSDHEQHEWWQKAVIYQIYPRSFQDSNGDGVGDLRGILSRLDYLYWLGVDAIWLSPIYPSPMADFGYDISDYVNVHPLFGALAEFDELLKQAHHHGMRVILDFVPNHTSDQHPWFAESRSSRDNPKRDWYIWRDPASGGGPPNNWLSNFGGSAWELDPATGQYFYHAFLKEQPDLNWRNPQVREAMHDVLRFWMDRGVDGFRVDVIWHIVKDEQFRDNPRNPDYRAGHNPHQEFLATYTADRPEVHDIIGGMRKVLDSYPQRMMVGEVYLPLERLVAYYGEGGSGVHMPFNFQLIQLAWNARSIASAVESYEASLPSYGWPNWVLGNHDNPRIASRIGPEQARVAAMLLLTLRGTPTMYYGEEIGMQDVPISPEQVQDPFEKNVPGMGLGRDPERTPMQWDNSPAAGFTSAIPWLPVGADSRSRNVSAQREEPTSILSLYRRLIELRRSEPALSTGSYELAAVNDHLFAFVRRAPETGRSFLIVLNFTGEPHRFRMPDPSGAPIRTGLEGAHPVLSTLLNELPVIRENELDLRSNEGVILQLEWQR